jgi:4-amino-4-deoxy-L-arabinose transferase-like glycosyltransferase
VDVAPPTRTEFGVVLMLALAARAGALWLLPDPHLHDAEVYAEAGRRLLIDGMLPVHNCMPLVPLLSGLTGGGPWTRALDVLLSVATVGVVVQLGWQLFADRRAALLAGAIAALWPHLVIASVLRLTETSFTLLFCLGLSLWLGRRWIAGSVALSLGVLARPTFELLLPVMLIAVVVGFHRRSWGSVLRPMAILLAVYAVAMSPWWAHNLTAYGQFVRLHTGGGLVAFVGHHPDNIEGGGLASAPALDLSPWLAIDDPIERDQALWSTASDFVAADPARFARRSVNRLMRLWRPWPNASGYRSPLVLAIWGVTFLPLLGLAVVHLGRHSRRVGRSALLLWLPVVYLTAVHTLTLASVRYRLPIEPLLILLAAHAASLALPGRGR